MRWLGIWVLTMCTFKGLHWCLKRVSYLHLQGDVVTSSYMLKWFRCNSANLTVEEPHSPQNVSANLWSYMMSKPPRLLLHWCFSLQYLVLEMCVKFQNNFFPSTSLYKTFVQQPNFTGSAWLKFQKWNI